MRRRMMRTAAIVTALLIAGALPALADDDTALVDFDDIGQVFCVLNLRGCESTQSDSA